MKISLARNIRSAIKRNTVSKMADYRIVKIGKCPVNARTYDGHIQQEFLNEDFYVVEYRKDKPSIWNLWHPRWRRVTYNMERHLRLGYDSWNKSWMSDANKPHVCTYDGWYEVGVYIPRLEAAKKILKEFKKEFEHNEAQGGDVNPGNTVVYSEFEGIETQKNSNIREDLDKLLTKKK